VGRARLIRTPCLRATATAPGLMREAGCVPAEATGTSLRELQRALAICERAEFWVQTKTTRGTAGCGASNPQQAVQRARDELDVGAPPVGLGAKPANDASFLEHVQVMSKKVSGDV
jgi:hypothetical protein